MKVLPDQLESFLKQQAGKAQLPPVFCLTGDEPLQIMECADLVRRQAKASGFQGRDIFHADAQFDWNEFRQSAISLSLFSEQSLIDLRIVNKSPGKNGSQAIRDYLQHPPADKILLIQLPRLDRNALNSAWMKDIEKAGVLVQVWELSAPQTMSWVVKRMRQRGMHPSPDAVRLLTERVEGNLLAADQEISKLEMLYCKKSEQGSVENSIDNNAANRKPLEISDQMVLAAVSDSSRFNVFDLTNAVMQGDAARIQHIHHNLREEGVAIQLVLWALTDLSRQLYSACFDWRNGVSEAQIIGKIPRPRQKLFQNAMHRLRDHGWSDVLSLNAQIDRLSKGQGEIATKGVSRIWQDLLELALILAGREIMPLSENTPG